MATDQNQDPTPWRAFDTRWGPAYVVAPSDAVVRYTTTPLMENGTQRGLKFDDHPHSCFVVLHHSDLVSPSPWHDTVHFNTTWFAYQDEVADGFVRSDGNQPSFTARRTLLANILPAVARWLGSDKGKALLDEGQAHEKSGLLGSVDAAENHLIRRLGVIRQARIALERGGQVPTEAKEVVDRTMREIQRPERWVLPKRNQPAPPGIGGLGR